MKKNLKYILTAFILSLPFWLGLNIFQKNLENFFYAQISRPFEEMNFVQTPLKSPKPKLDLTAKSALSVKINKNGVEKIQFQKETNLILPIASITKLMAALVVIKDTENYDFSKIITVSKEAAAQENVPEYGNLIAGEKKTVGELFNFMLVYSSNDAATALSEVIGTENFVDRMNKEAKSLGLSNTHFINPTGLDPQGLSFYKETEYFFNYSTVQDLEKLAKYILDEFPLIFETSVNKPNSPPKNGLSKLSLKENLIGGKTGYTTEAGGCMLLVLEKNGGYFINIILGTASAEDRVKEMQKLIDWLDI